MRIKNLIVVHYALTVIFIANCTITEKQECTFIINEANLDPKLFLSLKSDKSDTDQFQLKSSYYFDVDDYWLAKIINNEFYVSMDSSNNEMDVLFSCSDTIGNIRYVETLVPNRIQKRGSELIAKKLKVEVSNKVIIEDSIYFILKFHQAAFIDLVSRELDVYVFFSLKDGFIGSYFWDSLYPDQIIQKEGNILAKEIDYSSYSFVRIK